MTREEFMDIVYSELHSDGDNYRANRIIDAADEYAEEQTRWIPVSERLPERVVNNSTCSRDVLIMYDNGDMRVGFFVRNKAYDTGRWIAHDHEHPIYFNAIAWMPLPEQYQPEIDV